MFYSIATTNILRNLQYKIFYKLLKTGITFRLFRLILGCQYTASNHHCPTNFHLIDGKCMMIPPLQMTYTQAEVKLYIVFIFKVRNGFAFNFHNDNRVILFSNINFFF
jgi:hypothetical protein